MRSYRLSDLSSEEVHRLCDRNPMDDEQLQSQCRQIFDRVREQGDAALRDYTARWDKADIEDFRVGLPAFEKAERTVDRQVAAALRRAARNIRKFHQTQLRDEAVVEVEEGVRCWRERRPIDSVGLYVPGGSATLPSTALMLGIPATLAGCRRILLCVPPRRDGSVSPEVLVASSLAGVTDVYKLGGAQAIAALALGTESVPRVQKILGPGSRLVQTAKLLAVQLGVAIDMVAGPSEVLVIADRHAPARLIAADLISQLEHGSDSRAVLVSTSQDLIAEVQAEAEHQLTRLPRKELARAALEESHALLAEDLPSAFDFANQYAPEHLILHVEEAARWTWKIQSAGSVFVGRWSPEVAGDYASGTNHTLPTSGMARSYSGVSVASFLKTITFQELSREGFLNLAPTLQVLSRLEGLAGHERAVAIRLEDKSYDDLPGPSLSVAQRR